MSQASRLGVWCVSAALAVSVGFSLAGCNDSSQSTAADSSQTTEAVEPAAEQEAAEDKRQVLGTESADAVEVALTNGIGSELTSLKLRVTGQASYGQNLIPANSTIAADEEVRLFVNAKEDADNKGYDLVVTKQDKKGNTSTVEFAGVPFAQATSVKLVVQDDLAYVTYTTADGKQGSTQADAEAAQKKAAEEKAAQDKAAKEKAAKEKAAKEQAEKDKKDEEEEEGAYYDSEDFDDEDESWDDEGDYDEESAPSQTSDGCMSSEPEWN